MKEKNVDPDPKKQTRATTLYPYNMPGLPQVVRYTEEELIQTAVIDIPAMSTDKGPINMLTY